MNTGMPICITVSPMEWFLFCSASTSFNDHSELQEVHSDELSASWWWSVEVIPCEGGMQETCCEAKGEVKMALIEGCFALKRI